MTYILEDLTHEMEGQPPKNRSDGFIYVPMVFFWSEKNAGRANFWVGITVAIFSLLPGWPWMAHRHFPATWPEKTWVTWHVWKDMPQQKRNWHLFKLGGFGGWGGTWGGVSRWGPKSPVILIGWNNFSYFGVKKCNSYITYLFSVIYYRGPMSLHVYLVGTSRLSRVGLDMIYCKGLCRDYPQCPVVNFCSQIASTQKLYGCIFPSGKR